MLQMQEAIKKAATALLKRENKSTENKSFDDILKEALRVDQLSVKDLHGQLNTMDDLFNQVNDEVNKVLVKMEASLTNPRSFQISAAKLSLISLNNVNMV